MTQQRSNLNTAFLAKHHPDKLAASKVRHPYEPMPFTQVEIDNDHVCKGACVCNACWLQKGDPIHPRTRIRHAAKEDTPSA